jgi:hypothetical protein
MRLPPEAYNELDPGMIKALGGSSFLLKVPRISVRPAPAQRSTPPAQRTTACTAQRLHNAAQHIACTAQRLHNAAQHIACTAQRLHSASWRRRGWRRGVGSESGRVYAELLLQTMLASSQEDVLENASQRVLLPQLPAVYRLPSPAALPKLPSHTRSTAHPPCPGAACLAAVQCVGGSGGRDFGVPG